MKHSTEHSSRLRVVSFGVIMLMNACTAVLAAGPDFSPSLSASPLLFDASTWNSNYLTILLPTITLSDLNTPSPRPPQSGGWMGACTRGNYVFCIRITNALSGGRLNSIRIQVPDTSGIDLSTANYPLDGLYAIELDHLYSPISTALSIFIDTATLTTNTLGPRTLSYVDILVRHSDFTALSQTDADASLHVNVTL